MGSRRQRANILAATSPDDSFSVFLPGASRSNVTEPWHGWCRHIDAGKFQIPGLEQRRQAIILCLSGVVRCGGRISWSSMEPAVTVSLGARACHRGAPIWLENLTLPMPPSALAPGRGFYFTMKKRKPRPWVEAQGLFLDGQKREMGTGAPLTSPGNWLRWLIRSLPVSILCEVRHGALPVHSLWFASTIGRSDLTNGRTP